MYARYSAVAIVNSLCLDNSFCTSNSGCVQSLKSLNNSIEICKFSFTDLAKILKINIQESQEKVDNFCGVFSKLQLLLNTYVRIHEYRA